jgi:adenylate kinase
MGEAALPSAATRTSPNILVTGTPGCGKTTFSQLLSAACSLKHIVVGDLVKEKGLHEGWDEAWQAYTLDEDRLLDEMEDMLADGGSVVDYHSCDFFPERWFDLVVVLRADNTVLYDRLQKRGYSQKKLEENLQAEIFGVVAEEAQNSYDANIVVTLQSDSLPDMQSNVDRTVQWVQQWLRDRAAK